MTLIPRYTLAAAVTALACTMALAQQAGPRETRAMMPQNTLAQDQPRLRVGQRIDPQQLHRISRPGLYGMSQAPKGSKYGVFDGRLIRFDARTLKVQSIIREIDHILD